MRTKTVTEIEYTKGGYQEVGTRTLTLQGRSLEVLGTSLNCIRPDLALEMFETTNFVQQCTGGIYLAHDKSPCNDY